METGVDEGPLFGFHRMNAFIGVKPLKSFHFHDVEKMRMRSGIWHITASIWKQYLQRGSPGLLQLQQALCKNLYIPDHRTVTGTQLL